MKEITRIHIAKVPYDIEITAKKALEAYLKTLEAYSSDAEIISDIEIRITEILADRGVKKDNVISDDDVAALKDQLGEPSEFMDDGDMAMGEEMAETTNRSVRKLFRNTDDAVVGGVAAGIASFFSINPLWIRLIFLITGFASFGAVLLVYVVLWIAVPPARTAADKLQMAGRPVTAASIRTFNENEVTKTAKTGGISRRRVLTVLLGSISVLAAIIGMVATVAAAIAVLVHGRSDIMTGDNSEGLFIAAFVLALISGLLFTVLCILSAYASFAQKLTRRVLIMICVVIALGLASFGTAIGMVQYSHSRYEALVEANTQETAINLPSDIRSMKTLALQAEGVKVNYVVTNDTPTATLRAMNDKDGNSTEKVTASFQNGVLTMKAEGSQESTTSSLWGRADQPVVTMRGPALDTLTTGEKSSVSYTTTDQTALTLNVDRGADVRLDGGAIKTLTVTAAEDTTVDVANATISSLMIAARSTTHLTAGTVETATITYPQACPQGDMSILDFDWVSSGTMTVNGKTQPAITTDDPVCAHIIINNDNDKEQ